MKLKKVYNLEHFYEDENEIEYLTDLGVYSTKEKAEEALKKFKGHPKFKNHQDGFIIIDYKIDLALWEGGFFTY